MLPLPEFLQIEPVGQCNLRCRMCPITFRKDGPPYGPPAFMGIELFERILNQLPGIPELHLQGLGEPMMHPRFFDMVRYAVGRGMRVTTNSNLTLLNRKRAEETIESGLDCLHVSIDGATAQTYERIRIGARFDKVLHNLRLLFDKRGETHPRVHVVLVIMRENLSELPDFVRLVSEFPVEEIFVQHLCHDFGEPGLPEQYHSMRDFVKKQTLIGQDSILVKSYFDEARQLAHDRGIRIRLPRMQPDPVRETKQGKDRCDWPWRGIYISYQGYVMPCCMVATPDRINFGSAAEHDLATIWNNKEYNEFRSKLESGSPAEICQSCSLYKGIF